jgi:hypothetical protein
MNYTLTEVAGEWILEVTDQVPCGSTITILFLRGKEKIEKLLDILERARETTKG